MREHTLINEGLCDVDLRHQISEDEFVVLQTPDAASECLAALGVGDGLFEDGGGVRCVS